MKKIFLSVLLILFACGGYGATLKGGYVGCLTEKSLDEIMLAAVQKDERGFRYYLEKKDIDMCIITRPGLEISVLDVGILTGKAKVRVYVDKGVVFEMWTVIENIQRDE